MTAPEQIVHESETQRQHIRLNLPAQVEIDGERFDVKDISSGGMAIRNANDNFQQNQIREFTLHFPFSDFDLDIALKAEILHIDAKNKTAGCRFIDLTEKKISILNHVIKSYMTGDLVNAGGLIDTVSRHNFVQVRKHQQQNDEISRIEQIKRYTTYGAIGIATILLGFFVIQNVMDRIFVINAIDGTVQADQIEILSPASGTFSYSLAEGRLTVTKGQIIGTIQGQRSNSTTEFIGTSNSTPIISPCDCTVIGKNILDSEYTAQNEALFTLIPSNADVTVSVNIPIKDVHRLDIGSRAMIKVMGDSTDFKGKVIDIKMNKASNMISEQPTARAIVKTDQRISPDLIDRPASVEFHL